ISAFSSKPAGNVPHDSFAAKPSPNLVKFGTFNTPSRPSFANPSAQRCAICPKVLEPASPNLSASSAAPIPKESNIIINTRFIISLFHLIMMINNRHAPQLSSQPKLLINYLIALKHQNGNDAV